MKAARVDQLAVPTLSDAESVADFRAEPFDADAAGKRSMAYGKLDQLAIEHILGAR